MAPTLLFDFILAGNLIKDPNTPETPIIVQANNVAFSDTIAPQHQGLGLEDFVNFFMRLLLHCPLSNVPKPFFQKQVYEFYYSCTVDVSGQTISEIVGDGYSRAHISATTICQVLRLRLMVDYERPLLKQDANQSYNILIMISLTMMVNLTLCMFFIRVFLLAGSMLQG
ncbi:unnamed protein product [Lactuca saligna]|uniref:Uncharacterized protein n=1 Tax=Lactuca saligna TaxID=75948 RepID=A0AA36A1W8_LACSI|nr:unnamed protein product [Lactuca saligna]